MRNEMRKNTGQRKWQGMIKEQHLFELDNL